MGGEGGRLDQLQYDVRKGSVVNVNPTNTRAHSETPEIRKYKKRFNSEILCAALWGKPARGRKGGPACPGAPGRRGPGCLSSRARVAGVNLLVGTENGLMLLDRSGQGKVYGLIGRRRFQQMDVLEGLNLLITISGARGGGGAWAPGGRLQPGRWGRDFSAPGGLGGAGEGWQGPLVRGVCVRPSGKRNKLRVYYLSWLRNKILHNDPEVEKKQGWTTVGDMEGCGHYRVGEEGSTWWPGRASLYEKMETGLSLVPEPRSRRLGDWVWGLVTDPGTPLPCPQ